MRENRHARFIRLAEARTNKVIEMIRLIGNCSNKSNYSYCTQDVEKMFNIIQQELDAAKQRFYADEERTEEFHF